MREIEFEAHFGDVKKKVKLVQPTGAPDLWQLFIDNYYKGILVKINGIWEGRMHSDELPAEDVQALGERIDQLN